MKESRIDATDRLRREGRWGEASLRRDEARKQLRSEGKNRREANDEAWEAMLEQFPPLPAPTAALTNALDLADADVAILDRLAAVEPDIARDAAWVYSHLEHPRVQIESAPSLGAWGLLRAARSDPQKFLATILRAIPAPASRPKQAYAEQEADTDPGLADLDRMIADTR